MRFRGSIPSPYLPLSTLVASSHEETATTWGTAWFATPFTVRDFHPLLLAGFYRRFGQSHLMRPAQRVFVRQVGCDPCLRHPCASRGPESYWIPAYAGKTLKNAVPSCADRPAGFLCDPCPRLPCKSRGPDPVRLHNNARGIRPQAYWIPACAERRRKTPFPAEICIFFWRMRCLGVTHCTRRVSAIRRRSGPRRTRSRWQ